MGLKTIMSLYREGDFYFISDYNKREALEHDYRIVKFHDLWNYLRNNEVSEIMYRVHLSYYSWWQHHNYSTFLQSIKIMEFIAKYGWERYVTLTN